MGLGNKGYSPAIGWIAFVNGAFIVLLIFSAGAVSGAHFNPLITFSTFLTGLTSLPRAVLYILAQIAGKFYSRLRHNPFLPTL